MTSCVLRIPRIYVFGKTMKKYPVQLSKQTEQLRIGFKENRLRNIYRLRDLHYITDCNGPQSNS